MMVDFYRALTSGTNFQSGGAFKAWFTLRLSKQKQVPPSQPECCDSFCGGSVHERDLHFVSFGYKTFMRCKTLKRLKRHKLLEFGSTREQVKKKYWPATSPDLSSTWICRIEFSRGNSTNTRYRDSLGGATVIFKNSLAASDSFPL